MGSVAVLARGGPRGARIMHSTPLPASSPGTMLRGLGVGSVLAMVAFQVASSGCAGDTCPAMAQPALESALMQRSLRLEFPPTTLAGNGSETSASEGLVRGKSDDRPVDASPMAKDHMGDPLGAPPFAGPFVGPAAETAAAPRAAWNLTEEGAWAWGEEAAPPSDTELMGSAMMGAELDRSNVSASANPSLLQSSSDGGACPAQIVVKGPNTEAHWNRQGVFTVTGLKNNLGLPVWKNRHGAYLFATGKTTWMVGGDYNRARGGFLSYNQDDGCPTYGEWLVYLNGRWTATPANNVVPLACPTVVFDHTKDWGNYWWNIRSSWGSFAPENRSHDRRAPFVSGKGRSFFYDTSPRRRHNYDTSRRWVMFSKREDYYREEYEVPKQVNSGRLKSVETLVSGATDAWCPPEVRDFSWKKLTNPRYTGAVLSEWYSAPPHLRGPYPLSRSDREVYGYDFLWEVSYTPWQGQLWVEPLCPDAVIVTGAEAEHASSMGMFKRTDIIPTAEHGFRPIYRNQDGMYMYFSDYVAVWRICSSHTSRWFCKVSSFDASKWCPGQATPWLTHTEEEGWTDKYSVAVREPIDRKILQAVSEGTPAEEFFKQGCQRKVDKSCTRDCECDSDVICLNRRCQTRPKDPWQLSVDPNLLKHYGSTTEGRKDYLRYLQEMKGEFLDIEGNMKEAARTQGQLQEWEALHKAKLREHAESSFRLGELEFLVQGATNPFTRALYRSQVNELKQKGLDLEKEIVKLASDIGDANSKMENQAKVTHARYDSWMRKLKEIEDRSVPTFRRQNAVENLDAMTINDLAERKQTKKGAFLSYTKRDHDRQELVTFNDGSTAIYTERQRALTAKITKEGVCVEIGDSFKVEVQHTFFDDGEQKLVMTTSATVYAEADAEVSCKKVQCTVKLGFKAGASVSAEAKYERDLGNGVTLDSTAGVEAGVVAVAEAQLSCGRSGCNAGARAFAGKYAKAQAGYGIGNGDVSGNANGAVMVGIAAGASANVGANYEDGSIELSKELCVQMAVGGCMSMTLKVDLGATVDLAEDVADAFGVDAGLRQEIEDAAGDIARHAEEKARKLAEEAAKAAKLEAELKEAERLAEEAKRLAEEKAKALAEVAEKVATKVWHTVTNPGSWFR
mmetsp:Transcript_118896/g.299063  ORF Transcript_118896/g.299063 Transcript_118896/m.299063 type:complete len:1131 (+) Transcript_118896:2-3394(+)